jgi:hypothetical protein
MRTPAARVGIVVAALAAAVALFFALAGGDGDSATARPHRPQATVVTQSVARSATTKPQSASAATRRESAKPPRPTVERIWVRGGKAAGGVKRFEFKRGDVVRFSVHSKVADEVHIHGFDITKALPANRIVVFAFPADIEGVFEVELHGTHMKLAELRIKP